MSLGIVTGSGTHALPGFEDGEAVSVSTPYGDVQLTRGRFGGIEAVHLSRHGEGHVRLSNHVTHRANVWALKELGASAVIGCTACGAADPSLELGSLVVFDDLHFPSNRMPDGSLCTFFTEPGDPDRAHWILHGGPFSPELRAALIASAGEAGHPARDGGTYGYVDGPRFNTPSEIAQLAACGVVAVSQTAGPETVLCGELELPYALIGFVTDYANEVTPGDPTPVGKLIELMGRSTAIFADVLRGTLGRVAAGAPSAAGTVYRFGSVAVTPAPAVLIMARAPRRGEVRRALEPLLGPDGCQALQSLLIAQAVEWAGEVAPGRVHVAHDPPDAGPELRELTGLAAALFPQNGDGIAGRLADAVTRVQARNGGPLLVAWPDLPRLRPEHAAAALDDLAAGCDLVLGPAIDGGFYLIAMARPLPKLFALPEQAWRAPDVMALAVTAARDDGMEIGILRAERALHRPADVRAALADPLLPAPLERILRRAP